ncbi:hypothetical protein KMC72_gp67 [Paenibacillus phage Dragolir]|uniref:Uncharacterized protein n=1 Tax=Paenibacillus phage Dragolir TaxID=2070190 RepID=A0A2I7SC47_9CAUD|nr:hypothetical protein KMC72_gp67 [Paenibacillus phage Dragolir]AUS03473.1 hypothetical protein DRAGOLIR_67 [Paenibacillus phage Dragolir]
MRVKGHITISETGHQYVLYKLSK